MCLKRKKYDGVRIGSANLKKNSRYPCVWMPMSISKFVLLQLTRLQSCRKGEERQGNGRQLTFSCTTDDEDEEQLLAELGDFLWLRLSLPSGSGLLLPLSCLGRFRAFCTPIVNAQFNFGWLVDWWIEIKSKEKNNENGNGGKRNKLKQSWNYFCRGVNE